MISEEGVPDLDGERDAIHLEFRRRQDAEAAARAQREREHVWRETEALEQAFAANERRLRVLVQHGDDQERVWAKAALEKLGVDLEHEVAEAEAARTQVLPVRLTLEDARNPPREHFVIGSMIPFSKASVIFGPTTVGKSALAAQILFAFAAGSETLWGLPLLPDGGPVLVYTAEDSLDDWKRKAAAILKAGEIDVARALERFYVIDQSEGITRLSELVTVRSGGPAESISRRIPQPTEEQNRLIDVANEIGVMLLLVETTSRLVDEEDNTNFAALQAALGRIGRGTGAAVLVSHHATKAASKDNDNAIENARGGGALIANARNALSLFPAEPDTVKPYAGRFAAGDLVTLAHGKSTSSTRRHPDITLVRCDATWGAVFRLPDEVAFTPEQEQANVARVEEERRREWEQLRRLYEVVEQALPARPSISPSWLRDHCSRELGLAKHRVEPLVRLALERGVLKVRDRTERGITITLANDPRQPVNGSANPRADSGECAESAP